MRPENPDGNFVLELNGGDLFASNNLVELHLRADDSDSCLVWNSSAEPAEAGRVLLLADGVVDGFRWDLGDGDGEKIVSARVWRSGNLGSTVKCDTVVVDTKAPVIGEGSLYPQDRQGFVPALVAVQWPSAIDARCPPGLMRYAVTVEATGYTYSSTVSDTVILVEGLPASEEVAWSVTPIDAAGNVGDPLATTFVVWGLEPPALIPISAGTFEMGSPPYEADRRDNEVLHDVAITRAFRMADSQILFEHLVPVLQWAWDSGYIRIEEQNVLWDEGMGGEILLELEYSSIEFTGDGFGEVPQLHGLITNDMTWYGAIAYCDWLNELSGFDRVYTDRGSWSAVPGEYYGTRGYRLPTEAEWEYACRGGTQTTFWNGDLAEACGCPDNPPLFCCCVDDILEQVGWYCANWPSEYSGESRLKPPNPFGLYDLHGGYADWCFDTREDYPSQPAVDPVSNGTSDRRVIRGVPANGWGTAWPEHCRAACRWIGKANLSHSAGVRLVLSGWD